MDHVDPLTASTPAWDAFIQSIDPARLEQERFGHPGPDERPGSYGWRQMIAEHAHQHARFYAHRLTVTDVAFERMLSEASEWDHRHENALTETHLRIATRALHNPKEDAA